MLGFGFRCVCCCCFVASTIPYLPRYVTSDERNRGVQHMKAQDAQLVLK